MAEVMRNVLFSRIKLATPGVTTGGTVNFALDAGAANAGIREILEDPDVIEGPLPGIEIRVFPESRQVGRADVVPVVGGFDVDRIAYRFLAAALDDLAPVRASHVIDTLV